MNLIFFSISLLLDFQSFVHLIILTFSAVLGTVDFIWSDGSVIFRTCPQEKGKVILQIVSDFCLFSLRGASVV